jgi:hypothetical protein
MKQLFCIILTVVISLMGLDSRALTFRSATHADYHDVKSTSNQSAFSLNEHALYKYYMAAYGDPSLIPGNRFMPDPSAWMTRTNDSPEKGEYQYLGHSYENILVTNDRWFSTPGHLGTQFQPDYAGVQWNNVSDVQGDPVNASEKWADLLANHAELYSYVMSAPFFDSDHPTRGESPTGFSIASLLPGDQATTKSYLLSIPSQYEDGAVYLRYTLGGISNYNTIQIPALPRVECVMTAASDVSAIERGKTRDVVVTIDTRGSYALVYHEQMKSEISRRTYWAKAAAIAGTDAGTAAVQDVYRITVPDVSPNSTIRVRTSVYSRKVAEMGQPAEDTESADLFIGEIIPPQADPSAGTAGTITGTVMEAGAYAALRADDREGEKFDVAKGIPSTETLYAQVGGREYLIRQSFHEVTGTVSYIVTVRHPAEPFPTDPVLQAPVPLDSLPAYATTDVRVARSYSFWEISALEVYAPESATLRNDTLPGGLLTLLPSMSASAQSGSQALQTPTIPYDLPTVDFIHQADDLLTYHLQIGSISRSAGSASWDAASIQAAAQSAVSAIPVRNDRLQINGKTILSGVVAQGAGMRPDPAVPGLLSRDAFYMPGLLIPENVLNGVYPTTGTIVYARLADSVINGGMRASIRLPIPGVNPVVVHTPVVLAAGLVSDDAHNQDPRADSGKGSVVLGRPFVIHLSNSGSHLGIPGYGERDYSKYVADREVRLSFDTYSGNLYSGRFLQAGIWHSLGELGVTGTGTLLELKIPTWVQPGNHLVEIRTRSVNDASNGSRMTVSMAGMTASRQSVPGSPQLTGRLESGFGANLQQEISAVSVSIPLNVVGRIYDFQVTDVEDPMWETFFRTSKGNAASTGKRFSVGNRNINGDPAIGITSILPVMPGKNTQPGFQDRAVKLGYGILFEIKTIGDFHDGNDIIRISPAFAFVDRNGKNRTDVDLYYSVPGSPLVKAGSPEDTTAWSGRINLSYRGLMETEWTDTGKSLWNLKGGIAGYVSESVFAAAFLHRAQKGIDMFRTWRILMGEPVRTFRGPVFSSANHPFTKPVNAGNSAIVADAGANSPGPGDSVASSWSAAADETLAFASMQKWYGEYRLPPDTLIVPKGTDLSRFAHITPQDPVFLKDGYLLVNFRDMEVVNNGDDSHPALRYSGRDNDPSPAGNPPFIEGADTILTDKGNGWFLEGYKTNQAYQSVNKTQSTQTAQAAQAAQATWDLREGDAVAFYANRRSTDDVAGLGTH